MVVGGVLLAAAVALAGEMRSALASGTTIDSGSGG